MNNLGSKIKQIRIARNLTQQDIAEKMGVTRHYVSKWESNDRNINAEQLIQYAKIVGVTLDYFTDKTPDQIIFSAMMELSDFFAAEGITEKSKDQAYQDIMKIYLKNKEMLRANGDDKVNAQGGNGESKGSKTTELY